MILDDIIENIVSFVQSGKYVAMNTTDSSTMGYNVINFPRVPHSTVRH